MIDLQFMHCMGDDDLVVDAARVSFDRQADAFGPNQNESLIKFLAREGHTAPFSHPHVTFRCTAPIFVARQLAKSQVGGTWNEVSRRYVKTSPDYWKPTILRAAADDIKQGSKPDAHRRSKEFLEDYNELCIDAVALYNKMIAVGVCPEQARAVLPQSTLTNWVWTGSLLFWSRVYNLRIEQTTQEETREFAKLLGEIMEALYPTSWKALTDG
jgi:thymidylate synthase (FAD)